MTRGGDVGKVKRPGMLRRAWLSRLEPNLNKRGQFAPVMPRQWLAMLLAVATALLIEWLLLGLLAEPNNFTWPWRHVAAATATGTSPVSSVLALLTPVGALVTAVFAYRKSTLSLAESQRADVAAFQQRYIDAARLLADPNASTRIAGAAALGSLARDWVENRQECVDVLCGYLRVKPHESLLTEKKVAGLGRFAWHIGEDVVRTEVVSQLRRILTPGADVRPGLAPVKLDLQGAWFPPDAHFRMAYFSGDTFLDRATFTGDASFDGTTFAGYVTFEHATVAGPARFDSVEFRGGAVFKSVRVSLDASFAWATFCDEAMFERATFYKVPYFGGARFFEPPRAKSDALAHRPPLGPVSALSAVPHETGSFVSADGTTSPAVWIQTQRDDK